MNLFKCFAAVLMLAVVSGCAPKQSSDKPRVALVMKSLANEFFKTMEDGARAYAAEHGDAFELIVNGTQNEEDVAGQVALVEQMMMQSVDAIVIAPADSKALVAVLDRAQKQGITVVNIDNRLDADLLKERGMQVPFVGPDNREGALRAAEYLARHLNAGDPVAILGGIPSAFNAVQRRQGFEDGMKAGGMTIMASQSANWEMSKANEVASALLNEHPGLKAFLCANDNMALGAYAALRQADKTGQVLLVGFDNISAARDLVRDGAMLCTVDQHGGQLAVYGIQHALSILQGGSAPENLETPVDLVTAETLSGSAAQ